MTTDSVMVLTVSLLAMSGLYLFKSLAPMLLRSAFVSQSITLTRCWSMNFLAIHVLSSYSETCIATIVSRYGHLLFSLLQISHLLQTALDYAEPNQRMGVSANMWFYWLNCTIWPFSQLVEGICPFSHSFLQITLHCSLVECSTSFWQR